MKRFNRLSAISASFYSQDLYRAVAGTWRGIGVTYLLLLLGLCWLPSAARWRVGLRAFAQRDGQTLVSQLPAITIRDGVMAARPPGRHVIRLEAEGRRSKPALIIIDDSIDTVPSDITAETIVLTRREAAVIRPSRRERRVWTLTSGTDMDVTPEDVGRFIRSMAVWAPAVGYVGAVAGSLVFRVLQSLLYGALALAYARSQRAVMDYAAAVRLSAVAVTPVVILRTLLWFAPSEPAWFIRWPVALLITAGYIAFGVRAVAYPSSEITPTQAG